MVGILKTKLKLILILTSILILSLISVLPVKAVGIEKVLDFDIGAQSGNYIKRLHPSGDAYSSALYFAWSANVTGNLAIIEAYGKHVNMGSPDHFSVDVYNVTGTVGTDAEPDSLLYNETFAVTSYWGTGFAWQNITISETMLLTQGEDYAIVIRSYSGTWDDTHYLQTYFTQGGVAETNGLNYASSAWVDVAISEPKWKIYVDVLPPPPITPSPDNSVNIIYFILLVAWLIISLLIGLKYWRMFGLFGGMVGVILILTVMSNHFFIIGTFYDETAQELVYEYMEIGYLYWLPLLLTIANFVSPYAKK